MAEVRFCSLVIKKINLYTFRKKILLQEETDNCFLGKFLNCFEKTKSSYM